MKNIYNMFDHSCFIVNFICLKNNMFFLRLIIIINYSPFIYRNIIKVQYIFENVNPVRKLKVL